MRQVLEKHTCRIDGSLKRNHSFCQDVGKLWGGDELSVFTNSAQRCGSCEVGRSADSSAREKSSRKARHLLPVHGKRWRRRSRPGWIVVGALLPSLADTAVLAFPIGWCLLSPALCEACEKEHNDPLIFCLTVWVQLCLPASSELLERLPEIGTVDVRHTVFAKVSRPCQQHKKFQAKA